MATNPHDILKRRAMVLHLEDGDKADTDATFTTTSSSYQTVLSVTPDEDGDYIVLASANTNHSTTTVDCNVRLSRDDGDDGTIDDNTTMAAFRHVNSGDHYAWFAVLECDSLTTSDSIKVQCKSGSSGTTVGLVDTTIVLLNKKHLRAAVNDMHLEDRGFHANTTTSFTDVMSLNEPNGAPSDGYEDFVVFWTSLISGTGTGLKAADPEARVYDSTGAVELQLQSAHNDVANKHRCFAGFTKYQMGASTTLKIQHRRTTGVGTQAQMVDATLTCIRFDKDAIQVDGAVEIDGAVNLLD